MARNINYDNLRRQFELEPARAYTQLLENIEDKTVRPSDFSLRGLFESVVPDGESFLRATSQYRKSGKSISLMEAANATDLSTFANITGQIIFTEVKEQLENPAFIFPTLCDSRQSPFPYGERIPGVGRVGNKIGAVGEGEGYPTAGPNEEYVDIAPTTKKGLIVNVTREAVEFDLTGRVLQEARDLGYSYGVEVENRGLDVVFGVTNSYKRNGVATNTYLTSGAYINALASGNALADWTSVQATELLFDAILDPNTSQPVMLQAASLVVPSALKRKANFILMSSEVVAVDNTASANTIRTQSPNPLDKGFYGQPKYDVISNAYVKSRTGSATKWFFGDFKRAFRRYWNWDKEVTQAANNNEMQFTHDIWARTKISTRDVVGVIEPRYVASSDS